MPTPFVSVSIITYNQVDFISETLESAISQDYDNLEVVVADDASTDGTTEIVLDYARRYPGRVVALTGSPNLGITKNSTRGVLACRGEYVAIVGGDDVCLPGKIRAQVDWFERDPARVLFGHDLDVFDSVTGKTLYFVNQMVRPLAGRGLEPFVRNGSPFGASSVMVRASRIPSYGFDERVPIASDYLFWIDCIGEDGVFGFVDGVYARYRRHPQNVTQTKQREILTDTLVTTAIVEARHPELADACRHRRATALYAHGVHQLDRGDAPSARRYLAAAIGESWSARWRAPPMLASTLLPAEMRDLLRRAAGLRKIFSASRPGGGS